MKKQNYYLSMTGIVFLALIITNCSAPSTNTAANASNKTNPNIPLNNANATTASNANTAAGAPPSGTNTSSR